ncbi:MAG: thiamine pyrophosphate-binding protein [Rhodospirillaceae bacterium]|jgi:acetolactate synthase I/II/III large subunit|nr:thiamine pyrophosphate-binding protein [Rhodospirillaceae bacterium]
MNNADLIVATLKKAGVTHGFGIPSGNVLPLMESMRQGGIEFVLTAHEGSAGFAADVTGRLTGIPGLCIATLGPGATNLSTGVGNAWLDRSPMIAITCNLNTDQLGRRIQMYIDHHALFAPITKASLAFRHGHVADTLAEALHMAMSEPRGPVHIDLPEDVALAPAEEEIPDIAPGTAIDPAPDEAIARAAALLADAKRPVAVLGSTAMRMADHALLRRFVEHHNLPFAVTTMAKGLIDDDHPLALGCIERGRRQHQRALLHSADLIVGVGYDTIEVEYEAWIGDVPLLQIDMDPVDVAPSVKLQHQVTGDLASSLDRLCAAGPGGSGWTEQDVAGHGKAFQELLRPESPGFPAHQAIDAVRTALPHDGILTFDVGAHTHQIASQWAAHAPKSFLITNGWSSMGFGLPSAIAAKLANPEKDVVCLIGDGCFQMTCGELATAKRLGITLPVVVLDDRWLGLIRIKQTRRQYGIYGTELQSEEYREPPAHYFGVPAIGVRNPEDLGKAVEEALKADHPTVIEAVVNSDHYMDTVFD